MASVTFDDPALLAAMRVFLAASAAVDDARDDAEVLSRAEAKSLAAMSLRKRLTELGWSAPAVQRSVT